MEQLVTVGNLSKEEGKYQQSTQSNTTTDLRQHMKRDKNKYTSHTTEPRGPTFPSR